MRNKVNMSSISNKIKFIYGDICVKHGLEFAYLLDGGNSVETVVGSKHINSIYEGNLGRKVPTFIIFNGTNIF